MHQNSSSQNVNDIILSYLYDVTPEEIITINSHVSHFTDEEVKNFCMIYRNKRKDPQLILILCLLGFIGAAGIHRFFVGHIGLGILYFLTAGLCFIGTIVDLINYKSIAMEYNSKMITETLMIFRLRK